ncbi:hypothetical protein [Pyrobaculum neutrophilum]|uniref:Uncharacterized protein n=1 Tax=Pyrobaculum neutrophilum (strain DSM 2338 / JCM 9278 / NBRC 100436 / V24Sta) TaxID=444157 RepID=B1YC51_PYRNV|nr:hypothetical protein [Pyrobaculum neutrophilum]ACB40905.1 conserved hypothetical protein [Pyrobaculum neutrophilum V24Sta]
MRLVYAYAGFSLGIAVYLLYLAASGLRTPEIPIGAVYINLFDMVTVAFIVFTFYVIYKLTERRS